jgi:hypothetical protein
MIDNQSFVLRAGVHAPMPGSVTISVVLIFHVIFMGLQYTRPTRQSYRNDHLHVGVMPVTPSINKPDWCAEQVRTRLPCDLTLFCSTDSDFVGVYVLPKGSTQNGAVESTAQRRKH